MKTINNVWVLTVALGALNACSAPAEKQAARSAPQPPAAKQAAGPVGVSTGPSSKVAAATAAQLAAAEKVVPLVPNEVIEFSKSNIAVLVYTDPSKPPSGATMAAFKDLQAKKIIPEGARVDIRAGNMESMKTYFGQAIGWPVVIVRGPKGQSISSGEQAASMVEAGVKKVK